MNTAGKTATSKRFNLDLLRGKGVHYILDLTWAGQVFHLSRTDLQITSSATGEVLQYAGSLESDISWEEGINLFSAGMETSSIPITCVLPVNVPELIARGYDLLQATGELSMWVEGTKYEERRVLVRGRLADPEYGWKDEPINASLQSELFEDAGIIPAPNLVITTTSWPLAQSNALGMSYPVVFGSYTSGVSYQSVAYMVDTTAVVLLIAGHPCEAGQAQVYSRSGDTETVTLSQSVDALGNPVTIARPTAFGALVADDDYFVTFNQGEGGLIALNSTAALSGAGDILEYFLNQSTLPLDQGRIAAAKLYLNRFQLGGCILEGVTPFEFITANLSPILPMSIVNGPFGIYVIPWRYDATDRDVVDRIDLGVDVGIEQEGPVSYEGSLKDLVNEFKLKYLLSQREGETQNYALLTGDVNLTDPYASHSVYCRQSLLRYGKRSVEQETTMVRDAATAQLILNWWARARSLPQRIISYSCGYDRAWLERGDVVSITDPNLFLVDQIALVDTITYREDASVLLSLRIIENVAQKFKNKG